MHVCMCCVLLCVGGIRDVIRVMLTWSLSMESVLERHGVESLLVWCASFACSLCVLVCCVCLILCVVCDLCCCMCLCVCNLLFVCICVFVLSSWPNG